MGKEGLWTPSSQILVLPLSLSIADLCSLSGRLQGEGRARRTSMPTCLSPKVCGDMMAGGGGVVVGGCCVEGGGAGGGSCRGELIREYL